MTPPKHRKSSLAAAARHYAAPAAEDTATTPSGTSTSTAKAAKRPAAPAKKPATKKAAAKRARPVPPAGTEEFLSYWAAGTYDLAVAAYQVMQDTDPTVPEAFNLWWGERLDEFARMSVTDRIEAIRTLPEPPGTGVGVQRRHHIPSSTVTRVREAIAEDHDTIGVTRRPGAFAGLAGRWAAERVRRLHEDATGTAQLPPARPLPRGRRPAPPRD